jgi:hypothetical protein
LTLASEEWTADGLGASSSYVRIVESSTKCRPAGAYSSYILSPALRLESLDYYLPYVALRTYTEVLIFYTAARTIALLEYLVPGAATYSQDDISSTLSYLFFTF